jgi:hypothetical protein
MPRQLQFDRFLTIGFTSSMLDDLHASCAAGQTVPALVREIARQWLVDHPPAKSRRPQIGARNGRTAPAREA